MSVVAAATAAARISDAAARQQQAKMWAAVVALGLAAAAGGAAAEPPESVDASLLGGLAFITILPIPAPRLGRQKPPTAVKQCNTATAFSKKLDNGQNSVFDRLQNGNDFRVTDFDELQTIVGPSAMFCGATRQYSFIVSAPPTSGTAAQCEQMCTDSDSCQMFIQDGNDCGLYDKFYGVECTGSTNAVAGKGAEIATVGRIGIAAENAGIELTHGYTVGDCRHWEYPPPALAADGNSVVVNGVRSFAMAAPEPNRPDNAVGRCEVVSGAFFGTFLVDFDRWSATGFVTPIPDAAGIKGKMLADFDGTVDTKQCEALCAQNEECAQFEAKEKGDKSDGFCRLIAHIEAAGRLLYEESWPTSHIGDCRHWSPAPPPAPATSDDDGSTVPAAAMLYAATGSMAATAVTILVV